MKQNTLSYLSCALGVTMGLLCGNSATAQTSVYWGGGANDGVWSNSANWSGGYLPQTGDIPMFAHYHGSTTRNITVSGGAKVLTTMIFETSAANDFTFSGDAFEFAPFTPIGTYYGINIRSTTDAIVTINNDIRFNGGHHIISTGGSLTLNGNLSITSPGSADEYLLNYANAASGSSFTQGAGSVLSGTEVSSLLLRGRGDGDDSVSFNLNGANTFSLKSGKLINFYGSGTLNLGHSTALGNSANSIAVGLGTVDTTAKRSILITGSHTIANTFFIRTADGHTTIGGSNTSGVSKFTGDIYTYYNAGLTGNNPLKLTAAAGGTTEFSGRLITFPEGGSGDVGIFEVAGGGTVALTRAAGNSYTNGTLVSEGTLLIHNSSGSATGNGAVTIDADATLTGAGIIAPKAGDHVTLNGTLLPGYDDDERVITFNLSGSSKVAFGEDSTLAITLGQYATSVAFTTAGDWLTGTEDASLALTLGTGFSYDVDYLLFSNVTTASLSFSEITGYDDVNYALLLTQVDNNYYLRFEAVPEPSTVALILLPALGYGVSRFRRRA